MGSEQARRRTAFVLLFLLCGQEVLAARSNIDLALGVQAHLESLGSRSSRGPRSTAGGSHPAPPGEQAAQRRGADLGPDALGRLELALDSVLEKASEWHQNGGKEASLMELEEHLSRSGLSTFKQEDISEARRELEKLRADGGGVENLNLFLCKRTRAKGYTDEGWLFQDRKVEDGSFEVKCTSRVNVLHRGKVEEKKGSKEKEELMLKGINALKAHTKEDFDNNFPIRLKICRARGGCNRPIGESRQLVNVGDDVFGNGGLHTDIPIPDDQAENLWRESHQDSHLYAVCYDQQDECDGVMWTPKNFDMCNGWFEADDARATIGIIGEAIKSGSWMDFWKPGKGTAGGTKDAVGPVSGGLAGQAGIDGEDLSMADGLKGGVREHSGCSTSDWMFQQEMDALNDNKETLQEVNDALRNYTEKKRRGEDGKAELTTAYRMCKDAEEAGEGVDCDKGNRPCQQLRSQCMGLPEGAGARFSFKRVCLTKEQMEESLVEPGDALIEEGAADLGSVSRWSESRRRRRRSGSLAMDLLFPPYYYSYHPYCYSWYGYGYGYPIVPYGPFGYHSGIGFGYHSPGILLMQGAFHAVRGLAWVGGELAGAVGSGLGNMFEGCQGDGAAVCFGIVAAVLIILSLALIGRAVHKHCQKKDENCRSWWYRGGRLRTKMRKWKGLWEGVEKHVYDDLGGTLIFDGVQAMSGDPCVEKMQWGRRWVPAADDWDYWNENVSAT